MFNLVVATRNRSIELERLLKSILLPGNFSEISKIIIVDQSNIENFDKNSITINNLYSEKNIVEVMHIHDNNTGLSKARNLGLKYIDFNGYLCFPDDDCWYPENFFLQMREQFEKMRSAFLLTYYREEKIDRPEFKTDYDIKWHNLMSTAFNSVSIFINLSKVQQKSLVFDENIGAGTSLPYGEDILFSYKMFYLYGQVRKISQPFVYHPVVRGTPMYIESAFASSYVMLHPDLGLRFKLLFIASFARTVYKSIFSSKDRLILKGKVKGLVNKFTKFIAY